MNFNEFTSNDTKKQRFLKKKKQEDLAVVRKKKEIQKQMSVFVNGASGFIKDIGSSFEKTDQI